MISLNEIYWSAGFLEGEGCFRFKENQPHSNAGQVQKQPLIRLKENLGGNLRLTKRPVGSKNRDIWTWAVYSSRAAGVMMTLYLLMSPNRKLKIYDALKRWRARACHPRFKTHCKHGHRLSSSNIYFNPKGHRECKICARRRAIEHPREPHRRRRSISKSQLAFEF